MNLEVKGIFKSFGEKRVLEDIGFTAQNGVATGILGRNGVGKTTLLRIIMGVFPPDKGSVTVGGKNISGSGIKLGYLPEERGMYPKITIKEQLIYLGMLRNMAKKEAERSALYWIERLGMTEYYTKPFETLSKGNQQKIQLAAALIHDPEIIILDEPFSGLDPVNAQILKDVVNELVLQKKLVLFSSHQMSYVEQFCDDIIILNKGSVVLCGNVRGIKRSYDRSRIFISIDESQGRAFEVLTRITTGNSDMKEKISSIRQEKGGCIVTLMSPDFKNELQKLIVQHDIGLESFNVIEPALEDIFVKVAGEKY